MRFGLATRAAAENEKGAMLIGFSPDRLAGTNWVLSTVLTGAFGILVASVNSFIDPFTVTLLIVPALAAALLGKFNSFWVTTAAAFGIAMTQSWLGFLGTKDWFPHAGTGPIPGVKEALPFLVIVLALYLPGTVPPEPRRRDRTPPLRPAPRSRRDPGQPSRAGCVWSGCSRSARSGARRSRSRSSAPSSACRSSSSRDSWGRSPSPR